MQSFDSRKSPGTYLGVLRKADQHDDHPFTSCPDCGSKLFFLEAAFLCPICGYSIETVYSC